MYLRISNRGGLNRKFLELIGFTTKRDRIADTSVIGNKGSGTKLAAVAALRLGLRLAISSSDYLGRYILTFDVQDVDVGGAKAKQIVLDYRTIRPAAKRLFPLSRKQDDPAVEHARFPWAMTVDAFQDWDQAIGDDTARAFKVLREFICNAYDEDKGFSMSYADEVEFAREGHTTVYLQATDDVLRVLQRDVAKYFKFLLKEPKKYAVKGVGEIFEKSDGDATRLFLQGVMVECSKQHHRRSIYDYSLFDKTLLSEERIIKNWSEYKKGLGKLLASVTDLSMIKAIFSRALYEGTRERTAVLEASALATVSHVGDISANAWREVIKEHYGASDICLPSGNSAIDADAQQIYGHKVATGLPDDLKPFFRTLGYKNAVDIVPQQPEFDRIRFSDLDAESKARFRRSFRLFARHFPERAALPIVIFHAKDEKVRERILGYAGIGDRSFKEIWIAAKTPTTLAPELEIFETLVHEGRHVETQAGDYDRTFVHQAERDTTLAVLRADGRTTYPDGTPLPSAGDADLIVPNLVDPDAFDVDEDAPTLEDDDELDRAIDDILKKDIGDP